MFRRNENRNEGTFGCSAGTKTGTRVRSNVPLERKPERGYVRQNHPFTKPPSYLPVRGEEIGPTVLWNWPSAWQNIQTRQQLHRPFSKPFPRDCVQRTFFACQLQISHLHQNPPDQGRSRKIRFSKFPGSGLKQIWWTLYFAVSPGKTDKMLPKSWFSKPIIGHSGGSTQLDRPYCKRFWI